MKKERKQILKCRTVFKAKFVMRRVVVCDRHALVWVRSSSMHLLAPIFSPRATCKHVSTTITGHIYFGKNTCTDVTEQKVASLNAYEYKTGIKRMRNEKICAKSC